MSKELKTFDPSYTYGAFDMQVQQKPQPANVVAQSANEAKAVAEVQAAFVIAKKFPRNENECFSEIIESCKRPSLADQAMYAYPRGGQVITGASIRLAEVLAQKWKNCKIGIEILSQDGEKTEARAFAQDLENNYSVDANFTVKHQRTTKKGVTKLTDERDIREMVQNIGSRHLRGCILRIIPGDIVEAAINQCTKTQENSEIPIKEQIKRMIVAFDEQGVKVEHLEKFLGHKLDATIPAEMVRLKSVYKSLKDGMAKREDFFDIAPEKPAITAKSQLDELMVKTKESLMPEEKASVSAKQQREHENKPPKNSLESVANEGEIS